MSIISQWIIAAMILLILVSNIGLVWYYIITSKYVRNTHACCINMCSVFPRFACIILLVGITCLYLFANFVVSDMAVTYWLTNALRQALLCRKSTRQQYITVPRVHENDDKEETQASVEMIENGSMTVTVVAGNE